jgi:hypothetical protein
LQSRDKRSYITLGHLWSDAAGQAWISVLILKLFRQGLLPDWVDRLDSATTQQPNATPAQPAKENSVRKKDEVVEKHWSRRPELNLRRSGGV